MKVFILAAGLGTRLAPLTDTIPKVMIEVGGRPVLEHLVRLCVRHELRDIVINLHHFPSVVTAHFGDGAAFGAAIRYSDETDAILGGAGALKKAESLLEGDSFVVLNGDTVTDLDLTAMIDFHRRKKAFATFFAHETDHPYDSDLVECDADLRITRFFRPNPGDEVNPLSKSGAHVFSPETLDSIPSGQFYSLEKQLIPDLMTQKRALYAFFSDAYSVDMGTPERLARVRGDYDAGHIRL